MEAKAKMLVGKYFIWFLHRDGVVESLLDNTHYLVRFEEKDEWPETFAVVTLSDIRRTDDAGAPQRFMFFDTAEKRAKHRERIDQLEKDLAWIDQQRAEVKVNSDLPF